MRDHRCHPQPQWTLADLPTRLLRSSEDVSGEGTSLRGRLLAMECLASRMSVPAQTSLPHTEREGQSSKQGCLHIFPSPGELRRRLDHRSLALALVAPRIGRGEAGQFPLQWQRRAAFSPSSPRPFIHFRVSLCSTARCCGRLLARDFWKPDSLGQSGIDLCEILARRNEAQARPCSRAKRAAAARELTPSLW
jgi:hypothetical protein